MSGLWLKELFYGRNGCHKRKNGKYLFLLPVMEGFWLAASIQGAHQQSQIARRCLEKEFL
jgi:hypothetical protein